MNIGDNPSRGMFINACYAHTYTDSDEYWNSKGSPRLENKVSSLSYCIVRNRSAYQTQKLR